MVSDDCQVSSDVSVTLPVMLNDIKLAIKCDSGNKEISPLPSPDENMVPISNVSSPFAGRPVEMTVASAVSNGEKAHFRQQSALLDRWVGANNNNLYPCREEKERLAEQMEISYAQVNRWFANRRRKQTKRTKIMNSPVSVTPVSSHPQDECGPSDSAATAPESVNFMGRMFGSPADSSSDEKADMVAQHHQGNEAPPLISSVDDALHQYHQAHVVPDMSQFASDATLQKLLTSCTMSVPVQYNPSLLALLQPYALQLFQAQQVIQAQLMNQQIAHMAAQQQHQSTQPMWANTTLPHMSMDGGSISASPAHISDSEVSDMSELSPHPSEMTPIRRPHSPPFKDGHKLADPAMMALMDLSNLSEREQVAVNMLMEMHTAEIR